MADKQNSDILKHAFISWIIFSSFFCIAAYNKPFHVDEFYSWVYAERCTFTEILLLKDFGIGHPPLYHLIQKTIQENLPSYHFTYVRVANYLIGSLFVIIFVNIFLRYRDIPIFCYAASISASILDVFIFSRMWGLLCLSSLLLLWAGEKYHKTRQQRYFVALCGISVLGFFSDYNFILLLPYILLVIFSHKTFFNKILFPLFLICLIITWATSTYLSIESKENNITWLFYSIFNDIIKINFELGKVFFNFWFVEFFLLSFLALSFFYYFVYKLNDYKIDRNLYGISIAIFIFLISLQVFIRNDFLRLRHAALIIIGLMIILSCKIKITDIFYVNHDKNRLFLSIFGGLAILLSISPFFWRDLVNSRFLQLFLPLLLLFVYLKSHRTILYLISIIFSISGVFYIFSTGVSEWYPPPSVSERNVIFQNVRSYSTQYLSSRKENVVRPYIIDTTGFKKSCRLCNIATKSFEVNRSDKISVIGYHDWDHKKYIPDGFEIIRKNVNLTWLDKLQFKYLTPIYPRRFATFEYQKVKTSLR